MRKLLVFGTGDFADVVSYVLETKLGRPIAAYTVHEKYLPASTYREKPLVAFERIREMYPPREYDAVVGMIGKHMFDQREQIFVQLRQMGYRIPNVIDPSACVDTRRMGEGNIILANASIEAHCQIGKGNIIWQNVVMPHHNRLGSFNNLAPSVSLSGYSKVGNHCFVGNNVCLKNRVELSDYVFVGAGTYVAQSIASKKVMVPYRSYELTGKTGFDFL